MKKFIKEHYYLHFLVGIVIGYILKLTFFAIPIPIQYFLTILISFNIGIFWEFAWAAYGKAKFDKYDVLWTVIGAVLLLTIKLI